MAKKPKQIPLTTKATSEWRAHILSKRTVILISALLAIGALPAFIKYAVITTPINEMNSLVQDLIDSEPSLPSEWKYLDWQYIGSIDKPSRRPEGGMQKPIYALSIANGSYVIAAYMASEQDITQRSMVANDYKADSKRCNIVFMLADSYKELEPFLKDDAAPLQSIKIPCPSIEENLVLSFKGEPLSENEDWHAEKTFVKKALEWAKQNEYRLNKNP